MRVVLFCGGLGMRLRDYSETIPKPMVQIGYRPLIWWVMKYYAHFGHRDFVLCLGYKGHLIKQYFLNYDLMNADFTMSLGGRPQYTLHGPPAGAGLEGTLADTGASTLTGGRIARARPYIQGDVFMATSSDCLARM